VSRAEELAIQLGAPRGDRDGTKLAPMLCGRDESGERVLSEEGWLFELKLDGVRILADKRNERVSLGYRKGRDATDSYPEIADAVGKLAEERVVLDGEVVALDEDGKPDFQRLGTRIQSRGNVARRASVAVPVVYIVFDVLVVGDRDVTGLPIEARKAILEELLGETSNAGGRLRLHPTFTAGQDLFRVCRAQQLEGVVAKRLGSTYRPDERAADWLKVKCELDADFVVVGRLAGLEIPRSAAEGKSRPKRGRRHVRPEIVVSVRYMGITSDGLLRHPVFRGVRHDLAPEDCILGTDASAIGEREERRMRVTAPSAAVLSDGTTKAALCNYYEAAAPALLPHLRGRISVLLRAEAPKIARPRSAVLHLWPLPRWTPSWVRTCVVPRGKDELRGVIVEDLDTLLFLIEAGGASLQMTPLREASPTTADFVALRIEGPGAWTVALRAREIVEATGLAAFAKTSGAGYDVLVPVGNAPAEAAHALAALFAGLLAGDATREGATIETVDSPVAPYAVVLPVVPGAQARASLPFAWNAVEEVKETATTLDGMTARLARGGDDPMRDMLSAPVHFARAVEAIERIVAASSGRESRGP
jgi:bifunctional non-homologous end joining protein LigD